MLKEKKIWVVVADGASARIVKYFGHSKDEAIETFEAPKDALGEIMSDKAGRAFASVGGRRSGMELKSDPVRENEKAFANKLTDTLERAFKREGIDQLMVIAAPRTLGDIRSALSAELQSIVVLESNKNLTGLPKKALFETVLNLRKNQLLEKS